jgi:hypothetical protein
MIVDILIYSGVPNPTLELTDSEADEFRRLQGLCKEPADTKRHARLGYSGFHLLEGPGLYSSLIYVGNGIVQFGYNHPSRRFKDTAGVETYLLNVMRRHPEIAGHPWVPLVAGGALPKPALLSKLRTYFNTYEGLGVRVGKVWLNADQVAELRTEKEFTQEPNTTLYLRSSQLVGYLWGACVYQSDIVPANHAAFLQDDIDGALIGTAACMPL